MTTRTSPSSSSSLSLTTIKPFQVLLAYAPPSASGLPSTTTVVLRDPGDDVAAIADRFRAHCSSGDPVVHSTKPLLVELPGFINEDEADYLLSFCLRQELAPSTTGRGYDLDENVRTRWARGTLPVSTAHANLLPVHSVRSLSAAHAHPPPASFALPIGSLSARISATCF